MNQILCPCNCGTVIAESGQCFYCKKIKLCVLAQRGHIHTLVCSECLANADPSMLKQVVHMSVPKHKELCDKLATLQNENQQLAKERDEALLKGKMSVDVGKETMAAMKSLANVEAERDELRAQFRDAIKERDELKRREAIHAKTVKDLGATVALLKQKLAEAKHELLVTKASEKFNSDYARAFELEKNDALIQVATLQKENERLKTIMDNHNIIDY